MERLLKTLRKCYGEWTGEGKCQVCALEKRCFLRRRKAFLKRFEELGVEESLRNCLQLFDKELEGLSLEGRR